MGNTIHYVNNLNILSGTINSTGGFWVDGNLNISGGNLKINTENMTYGSQNYTASGVYVLSQVKITGGNVDIKANSAAIHVPGNSLYTEDTEDGVFITGGNVVLSTQDADTPAISAGQTKRKNIVINGGNITLSGDYGVYTNNGVITINGFESFNANGVKKEVFKVAAGNGNEIKYADADYSKVDKAIEKANKLNKSNYKDFSAVEVAINAVVKNKNILEQNEVDAMEKAIIDAINSLEYLDADYSKVDETIAKANKLNKSNYKDFSAVEVAINAVVKNKNISEQNEVDAMEKAIINAINSLEYLDADYSKVDEAIAKANNLNKDDYKDFSAVEKAISAVVRGKNILEQGEVDTMEKAINEAINSLEVKTQEHQTGELDDVPKTGEDDLDTILIFIMIGALAGIVVLNKQQYV